MNEKERTEKLVQAREEYYRAIKSLRRAAELAIGIFNPMSSGAIEVCRGLEQSMFMINDEIEAREKAYG